MRRRRSRSWKSWHTAAQRWSLRLAPAGSPCPSPRGGIRVDGIDLSPAMVARLRAKPGGDQLAVTIGDFADVDVTGTYRLIYVVFNTLFNLLTQEDQVRCFDNDGVFLVEAASPADLFRLRN